MASRLILASQSPRRQDLLRQVGLEFDVKPADIDESIQPDENVDDYVLRVAKQKAQIIAQQYPDAIVLAADTTVSIGTHILTKAQDKQHAFRMWQLLSGQRHQVKTSVVICYAKQIWHDTVCTDVYFKELTQQEMQSYWASGEAFDKAGAYAIQGRAAAWVQRIEGSYSNVVGLPLFETIELLKQLHLSI